MYGIWHRKRYNIKAVIWNTLWFKIFRKSKDEPNVAELMEQRLRGKLEEVKREYSRLEKREREKKEGR